MQEGKVVVWGDFTHSWGKKRRKSKGEGKDIHLTECKVSENSKEVQEGLLKWTVQRSRGKQ